MPGGKAAASIDFVRFLARGFLTQNAVQSRSQYELKEGEPEKALPVGYFLHQMATIPRLRCDVSTDLTLCISSGSSTRLSGK